MVLAVAFLGGAIAFAVASFGTSTCNAEPAVVARNLSDLRIAMIVIGCVVSLAPAGWALLAHRVKTAAAPWGAIAVIVLALTFVAAVRTSQTNTFCLF